jgi:uncharacterized membrane protein YhaH (DUF805 family)
MSWYLAVLKKYAQFSGRARRAEYWWFFLVNVIVSGVLGWIEARAGSSGVVGIVYSLAVLVPSLAVSVRRLHDTGRSGWWMLLLALPIAGAIVLLVFAAQDGNAGPNQYGPSPKSAPAAQQTVVA